MCESEVSAVDTGVNENNLLLAAFGDSHPFNDPFELQDLIERFGLFFDPNDGHELDAFIGIWRLLPVQQRW
jgi:hypothetical protein